MLKGENKFLHPDTDYLRLPRSALQALRNALCKCSSYLLTYSKFNRLFFLS